MIEQTTSSDDDVDLLRLVRFLVSHWKVIVVSAVLGGIAGLAWASTLPEKFQASVSIAGGKVAGSDIEPIAVLSERMQSPTFYSSETLKACLDGPSSDPASSVLSMLKPSILRSSTLVSASAKMKSRKAAQDCLISLLNDVRSSQKSLFDMLTLTHKKELDQLQAELSHYQSVKAEELAYLGETLLTTRDMLSGAERAVQALQINKADLDIDNDKFPATSLVFTTLLEKEKEVGQLRDKIAQLESQLRSKSGQSQTEKAIAELRSKIILLEQQSAFPITQDANFATPVFSPSGKVEPRKAMITASGLVVGGFFGLLFVLLQAQIRGFRQTPSRQ
jgi:hypothetical protein